MHTAQLALLYDALAKMKWQWLVLSRYAKNEVKFIESTVHTEYCAIVMKYAKVSSIIVPSFLVRIC